MPRVVLRIGGNAIILLGFSASKFYVVEVPIHELGWKRDRLTL